MTSDSLERRLELTRLYDLYGPVLTEKQRLVYEMHDLEDLSLFEIAQELDISRQGVSDQLRRARDRLEELESSLGFARRLDEMEGRIHRAIGVIEREADRIPAIVRQAVLALLSEDDPADEGSDVSCSTL